MSWTSSSWTILITVWAGVSDAATSAPVAFSLIALTKSLATLSETSASSKATRTSRNTSATSVSERRPRFDIRLKIAPKRSLNASSIAALRFFRRCVDLGDRIADGLDLLGFLVGNIDIELGLESHHQFDLVERVGSQIVGDRRFQSNFGLFDAELFDDDLFDFFEGISGHDSWFSPQASHQKSAVDHNRLTGDVTGGIG